MTKNHNLPTNKKFGLFLSSVLFILSIYFYFSYSKILLPYSIILFILILLITILFPRVLFPLNLSWFYLGIILGKIISPIIISLIYYMIVSPVAIVTRIFGRDELKIKKRKTNTYWVIRSKQSSKDSFFNQY